MAVVDYGSIVKGALKSFNEVDQYIQAEEEREYQKAKERRDHLYKSDRDKMADFWREHQQNYQEYRDNVQDDFNERKFEETKNQNAHQREMDYENLAFKQRQQDEIEKVNETNARNQAFKNALALEKAENEKIYKGIGGSSRSKVGGYLNGVSPNAFINLYKENKAPIDAIIKNSDSIEQKLIALEEFVNTLPEDQREPAKSYFAYVDGYNKPATVASIKNISNGFKTVVADAVKDGKSATRAEIAQNFVEYANEFLPQDIEQVFKPTIEVMASGLAKYKENGKDVLIKEFGGYIPNTARFYHIQDTDTVGIIGDFMVNGQVKHIPITNNGQPYALNDGIIVSLDSHTLKAQIDNSIKNRPKLLSEKEYNQINKDDPNRDYTNYLLENAMSIPTYNKDPNIVTLKDVKAQNYEINQAIQQSQEKPGTSAVYGIYKDRYNGVEKGDKVYIDDGKVVVPISEEEKQIEKSYKAQADKIISQQLNEDDIAKVQKTQKLSRADAIKYIQDEASQENFNKHFKPMHKKMATVDAITKGFQGDFYDNGFDVITRDLQGDYAFVNEKANKVISVEEYHKLPKEEKDKYEKTSIRNDEDRLNVALMQYVPNEDYRKTFIEQYKQFKDERDGLRADAGGDEGDYVRKFLKTKISEGDKSLSKEKLEEMYRIIERYKDEPLGDVWGIPTTSKAELLSELKDAGLSGTDMYRVIKDLQASGDKGVNSFNEKRYSYIRAYKPNKPTQKLSDATSKQQNTNNNGGGGYQSTSTSVGGVVKGNKYEGGFPLSHKTLQDFNNHVGLSDFN